MLSHENYERWVTMYGMRERLRCHPDVFASLSSPEVSVVSKLFLPPFSLDAQTHWPQLTWSISGNQISIHSLRWGRLRGERYWRGARLGEPPSESRQFTPRTTRSTTSTPRVDAPSIKETKERVGTEPDAYYSV